MFRADPAAKGIRWIIFCVYEADVLLIRDETRCLNLQEILVKIILENFKEKRGRCPAERRAAHSTESFRSFNCLDVKAPVDCSTSTTSIDDVFI